MHKALILDDDVRTRETLAQLVSEEGYRVETAADLAEARESIADLAPDLAIVDLDLPDGNGMEFVAELQNASEAEILILTGHGSVDTAVEALHSGVVDYLTKPVEPNRLLKALHTIGRTLELRSQVRALRKQLRDEGRFAGMVGQSAEMQSVFDLITKVAPSDSTVMVLGETGTGKELVARAVHELSRRAEQPFIAVNCAAIQETLLESELFGHEPGAFTGAAKRREGLFEQAHGGTLFLDEILEMPTDMQVRLLRVLESRTLRRVGGNKDISVDVRLVTATNKDPQQAIRDGTVREDLVYRLMVFPIHLPALRARAADIPLLAQHFLDLLAQLNGTSKRFTEGAMDRLSQHAWPGNVRELRNIIERAYILGEEAISEDCVILDGRESKDVTSSGDKVVVRVGTSIAEAEQNLILATLAALEGDKPRAAEVLGISLRTLYNRLESYGTSPTDVG